MKQLKPLWVKGIVKIKVTGHYPERFFDFCARNGITIWSIEKCSQMESFGDIYLSDIHKIRKLRRETRYKVSFVHKRGLPFLLKRLKTQHHMVLTFILASLFFLYLTQSIWFIDIEGVSTEIESDIRASLSQQGIKRGKLKILMDKPYQIQSQLLTEHPDLLWVGINSNGVTYHLEVITKKQPAEREKTERTHLYARKDGVIREMFVAKGRPLVGVNDFVRKGQLLVTGELDQVEGEDAEEEKRELIAIDAEIYATTWYESEVIVPLEAVYQVETGLSKDNYYLKIASFQIPIWGFGSSDYEHEQIESSAQSISISNWELPISFIKKTHKEVEMLKRERSEESTAKVGLDQARKNLERRLDETSSIISEKILHQSIVNGKVKLHVYFTVNETIANTTSRNQGD